MMDKKPADYLRDIIDRASQSGIASVGVEVSDLNLILVHIQLMERKLESLRDVDATKNRKATK